MRNVKADAISILRLVIVMVALNNYTAIQRRFAIGNPERVSDIGNSVCILLQCPSLLRSRDKKRTLFNWLPFYGCTVPSLHLTSDLIMPQSVKRSDFVSNIMNQCL